MWAIPAPITCLTMPPKTWPLSTRTIDRIWHQNYVCNEKNSQMVGIFSWLGHTMRISKQPWFAIGCTCLPRSDFFKKRLFGDPWRPFWNFECLWPPSQPQNTSKMYWSTNITHLRPLLMPPTQFVPIQPPEVKILKLQIWAPKITILNHTKWLLLTLCTPITLWKKNLFQVVLQQKMRSWHGLTLCKIQSYYTPWIRR